MFRKTGCVFLAVLMVFTSCISIVYSKFGENTELIICGHLQHPIWHYENIKNKVENAVVLEISHKYWEVAAAACIVPAFIDRKNAVPIVFDDGFENSTLTIPYVKKNITSFGTDIASVTARIASTYWKKAETVVVAYKYEHILWSVPIASFLRAPILVKPSQKTLEVLNTKCMIVIGDSAANNDVNTVVKLDTKEEVWNFQIDLFDMKGQMCDYIVITNPYDIFKNNNIKLPILSLTAAPLAAYRLAIVQTGNYTGDREKISAVGNANKRMDDVYANIKPYFEKVKNDTYIAAQFLIKRGHVPKYVALVGDPYALPDWYFDYHISYYYWSAKLDYIASTAPYGNLSSNISYETYPREDMAVGRIIGQSVFDTTYMLVRTFFYTDFLNEDWKNKSAVIDGHRLNQPNKGGPPASNKEPYYPAGEIDTIFYDAGFNETYYLPRNITDYDDNNTAIDKILDCAFQSSLILINAHGGRAGEEAVLEIGIDSIVGKEYVFILNADEVLKRQISPAIIYVIGCETGTTVVDIPIQKYLVLSFIHSGAVVYIAPDTYQSICFWESAPAGPEADQAILFFQNLLNTDNAVGTALSDAKWLAAKKWLDDTTLQDDVGGNTLHLYGDPAFKPYKPKIPFVDRRQFDILMNYYEIKDGKRSFKVTVTITDFDTDIKIDDATVTIIFQNRKIDGYEAIFDIPSQKGVYKLEILVKKEGYEDCTVKYWLCIPGDKGDFTVIILIIGAVAITAFIVYMKVRVRRSR